MIWKLDGVASSGWGGSITLWASNVGHDLRFMFHVAGLLSFIRREDKVRSGQAVPLRS